MKNVKYFFANAALLFCFFSMPIMCAGAFVNYMHEENKREKEFWNNVVWVDNDSTMYHTHDTITVNNTKYLKVYSKYSVKGRGCSYLVSVNN